MAAATIESGVYFIQNYGTGTVMDLVQGSYANGTKTQGHSKRELWEEWVSAQLWIINQVNGSDNTYTIQNAMGGTFMTLNKTNSRTPVECFKANNTDNQKWEIFRSNHPCTAYGIRNKATKTYIDIFNGSRSDGAEINGWEGNGVDSGTANQLWHIIGA